MVYPVVAWAAFMDRLPLNAPATDISPIRFAAANSKTAHGPPKARSISIYGPALYGFPIFRKNIARKDNGIAPAASKVFLQLALLYKKTKEKYLFNAISSPLIKRRLQAPSAR